MAQLIPTVKELFKLVMIDRKRKVKTIIELKDESGDVIPVNETVEKLVEYISDKVKENGENACKSQILPLVAQSLAAGLVRYLGDSPAAFLLSDAITRDALIHMMGMSFYLLKWIQQKNIKIHTIEESITQEEIDMYDRCSKASDLTVRYAAAGGDPKKAIREMLKRGLLKESDLAALGAQSMADELLSDKDDTEKN